MSSKTVGTISVGVDIQTSALFYTHTCTATGMHSFQVMLANATGNGDYVIYLTKQIGGAGAVYQSVASTTAAVGSGVTTPLFPTIQLGCASGDVIKFYIDGVTGDSAVTGLVEIWVEDTVADIQSGLATSANQTTVLARIGAFTGTGVNTILGLLKALASKAATLPTDIGGTFNPATDSNEALADAMPPAPPATVTVSDITQAALAKFANTDTLEVAAVAGSVAELSQCNAAGFPAGSIEYTLTIESPGGIPIAGASVWISTDVGMTNIIWRGVTDTFGTARDVNNQKPWLDAGLYQFWVQDDNWTDSNPTPMVVS